MISIILNVYNGEKYIKRCVESVLAQTYQNFELLIIDDGSTDSTAKIIDSYPPTVNVKVFHTENKGLSGSRRYGLSKVSGEFILKYWALEHGINWYVLLNGKYWQFRHQIKAILKLNRKR